MIEKKNKRLKALIVHSPIDSENLYAQYTESGFLKSNLAADVESREAIFAPPTVYKKMPPLWLISLGSYLKERDSGINFTLVDGQFFQSQGIISLIKRDRPEVVGIRPILYSYQNSLKIAREAKKAGARIIMGGPYAAGLAREILENRGPQSRDYCVDAICYHDGEKAFYDFVAGKNFKSIPNLVYWENSGIKFNRISPLNLDDLPLLDFDLIEIERYFGKGIRGLILYSGLGCSWRAVSHKGCLFCPQLYKERRLKSPARFWSEIDLFFQKYRLDTFRDINEDFLANKKWVLDFFRFSKLRKDWPKISIYARADRISSEAASILKNLKVVSVFIGLESGAQSSLNKMGKGCSLALNLRAVKNLTDKGIRVVAGFVLGSPGESKNSLFETLNFARRLAKNYPVFIFPHLFTPFPNTAALKMLIRATGKKYLNKDYFNRRELMNDWADYFCRTNYGEINKFFKELKLLNCKK